MKSTDERQILRWINSVCDQYEDKWLSGLQPQIHQYIPGDMKAEARDQLFNALLDLYVFYHVEKRLEIDFIRLRELNPDFKSIIDQRQQQHIASSTIVKQVDQQTDTKSHRHSPTERTLTPGQIFGRYQILETLGSGGMGSIYLANDPLLSRNIALKIPKFQSNDPDMMERFRREAKASAGIQHRNICPIYDIGEESGQLYITMGYVKGKTLSSYIDGKKALSEFAVVKTIRKLALALDEAHRHGIVHRDLKPANVMIDEHAQPVLMDFGLARQVSTTELDRLTKSGMIVGTPAYMSPEQVRHSAEVGPPADIYSLGVIMYQMLTGKCPFNGSDLMSIVTSIIMDSPPAPSTLRPHLDRRLEQICLKALAKSPEDRFSSMADFAVVLGEVLQDPVADSSVAATELLSKDLAVSHQYESFPTKSTFTAQRHPRLTEAEDPAFRSKLNYENSTLEQSSKSTHRRNAILRWVLTGVGCFLIVILVPTIASFIPNSIQSVSSDGDRDKDGILDRLQQAGAVVKVQDDDRGGTRRLIAQDDWSTASAKIVEVSCTSLDEFSDSDLIDLLNDCPELRKLSLNITRVTPRGLSVLASSRVQEFFVRTKVTLTSAHLHQLGSMSQLRVLGLWDCGITDQGLESLASLQKLESLNLGSNPIRGPGISKLENLSSLNELLINNTNGQSNELLRAVGKLQQLTSLGISCQKGADLSLLSSLQLQTLKLSDSKDANIEPFKSMPLVRIELQYQANLHEQILRSIPTLRYINGKPIREFFAS